MPLSQNRAYRNASRGGSRGGLRGGSGGWRRNPFVMFLVGIVVVWLLISVLGLIVRGLFFLTVIALVALILTGMYGAFKLGRRQ